MVGVSRRRPKATIVSKLAVDHASSFLQDLPEKPKENLSLREAVDRLRSEIQAAFAKGYSYEEVAQLLNQQGIDISASTLKNYVPSGKRQAAKEQKEQKEQAAPGKPRGRRRKQETDEAETTADDSGEDEADFAQMAPEAAPETTPEPLEVEAAEAAPAKGTRRRRGTAAAQANSTAKASGRPKSTAKTTTRSTTRRRKADA